MEPANQSLKADRALPLLLVNLTVRSFNVSPVNDEPEPCQLIDSGRNRFLIVVFTVIFCVSLIGNSLVILTIVQNRWMRTITNLFLLNMAISDLLLTVICMPPTLTAMLFECFIWGGRMKWMCTLMSFLQLAANANTLVAIALERYFALCRPLHSRQWQTKSNVVRMLIVIWTAACITSIPPTFVVEVIEIRPVIAQTGQKIENSGTDCNSVSAATQLDNKSKDYRWPKKWSKSKSLLRWKYPHLKKELANSVTTIPLANVSQSSSPVAPAISSHGNPSPRPQGRWSGAQLRSTHTEKSLVTKKRVIKMLAMIVVEFFVCWMPFYAYYLIVIIHPSLFDSSCHVAFLIIAYLSTCTNPITYCFMNSKFRQAFLAAFGCHVNSKALRRQRCYGTRHNQPCVYKVTPPQETPDNVQQEDNEDDDDESDSSSQQDYVTAYEGSRNSSEDRTTFQLMLTDGSFVQTSPAVEKADHTKLPIIKMEGSAKIV